MAMAEDCSQHPDQQGDPSYPAHLCTSLNQLRQQDSLCDVTIVIGNQRFPAHKAVLCCASPYFESMFTSRFHESTSSEVTISGMPESFTQLIQFAYTGFFNLTTTNIAGVLSMACYMHFAQAVEVCARFARDKRDTISIDDRFEIWSVADNYGGILSELAEAFSKHLVCNFPKFLESQNFLEHASADFLLKTCLENEDIETEDSTTYLKILQVVVAWLKFNWDVRHTHAVDLFKKIRLGLVPQEELAKLLEEPEIGGIEECRKLIEEVVGLQNVEKSWSEEPLGQRYPHWFATRNTITAFVKIGGDRGSHSAYFNVRDAGDGYWQDLDKMAVHPYCSDAINGMSLLSFNGMLYAAGGWDMQRVSHNDFCVYDMVANQWKVLPSMKAKRSQTCLVFHQGFIYAIGGRNYGGDSSTVERYSLNKNQWEFCSDIKIHTWDTCAVSYKERIVICDLISDKTFSFGVQIYDPQKDTWHVAYTGNELDSWELIKAWPLLTIHDDMLYLVSFPQTEQKYCIPTVKRLEINFNECNGSPCKCLDVIDLGDGCVEPNSNIKAFKINDKAFISMCHSVYQVFPRIDSEGRTDYQLNKWHKLGQYYDEKDEQTILFRFDKRCLKKLEESGHNL